MLMRPRQQLFVERSLSALKKHQNTLGVAPTGCHAPGTSILMFDGRIKTVEDIQVGDQLMGPDSRPRTVLELHRGQDEMVEIRPLKGEPFVVNRGHILSLVRTNNKPDDTPAAIVNLSVSAYLEQNPYFKHLHKLYRCAVDFPPQCTPDFDPYFLGLLLGDGSLKYGTPAITTMDFEVVDYCYTMAEHLGLSIRRDELANTQANTYFFTGHKTQSNPLKTQLKRLGVWGCGATEKYIPDSFKTGSRQVRAELLAGLIDTDGYLFKNIIEFSSASQQLADDVAFIARSLGFYAVPKTKWVKGSPYYRFTICGDFSEIPIRVARRQPGPRRQKKNPLRTGFTIHRQGWGDYYGFSVDADQLYLMGDFTATHNSGKTVMLSGVIGQWLQHHPDTKSCVLAHRDELTRQNEAKFLRVNPELTTSVCDANSKDWSGQTTFAMVQTLGRETNLQNMPRLDLLVIDEAHHAAASTYRRIIDSAQEANPDLAIFGVTATPNRGDKKALRPVFSNVADQISLTELIQSGHLVPPRTYVIDVGTQDELSKVKRTVDDFDMAAVDAIMNKVPITEAVIKHWREKAGDRQTVVFCSTVHHAKNVCEAFIAAGISSEFIHGELTSTVRKAALARFEQGESQVVVNVAVLTEGWDFPPTSCIVLLRPSSYKSTLIQMVGRGLRIVDPNEYPGITKTDCVVLDFGTSTLLHGSLEQDINLDGQEDPGEAPTKECPACEAVVPASVRECPLCGYIWEKTETEDKVNLTNFVMSEIDLLERSSFRWCDLFGDDAALMATGFEAWAGVFFLEGRWYGMGGGRRLPCRLLAKGDRTICLAAADDWLNEHESEDAAKKSKRWLNQTATSQQIKFLPPEYRKDFGLTRYHASCLLAFQFNKRHIQSRIFNAAEQREVA